MRLRDYKKQILIGVIVWATLILSFFGNFFGVGLTKEWFTNFEQFSSAIIEKTSMCKNNLSYDGPVITRSNPEKYLAKINAGECNDKVMVPYDSQYGLQTRVISALAPIDDALLPRYFKGVQIILAAITSLLFTFVILRVRSLFGTITAGVLLGLLAISPWVAGYARNMYWVEPLMIAPFVLGFVAYPWLKDKKATWIFYVLIGGLLFLKFLDGYEHASTLAVSAFIPVVFYETLRHERKLLTFWKEALFIIAVSAVAIAGALFVNIASLAHYYKSWPVAIVHVQQKSEARSLGGLINMQPYVIYGFKATLPSTYDFIERFYNLDNLESGHGAPYKYTLLSALNYLLLPAVTLPLAISGVFGVLLQSIFIFIVIGWLCIYRIKSLSYSKQYYVPLLYGFWLSLAGAFSWLILMPAHAYPHAHLNAIIFYIPFLIICYIAIGVVVQDRIAYKDSHRRKK